MLKTLAASLGLLAIALFGFIAYTAPAPYTLPEERFVEPRSDFEPRVPTRTDDPRKVIVLIYDGLSPAAVRAADTPTLDRLAREGASSLDMLPEFPTLSLPNHFTLGTGCRPGRHGVVSNHFRDPDLGLYNAKGDADWLADCELIHETAERQGVRTAALATVGNSSSRRGRLASVAEPFRIPARTPVEQADRVLEILDRHPEIALILAYATAPDEAGHVYGPTAPETLAATAAVDAEIARVVDALEARGLRESTTLIVTTDHGMVETIGMLNVDGIVRRAGIDANVVGNGVMGHVHLEDASRIAEARAALEGGEHYEVVDPATTLPEMSVAASARMGDLVIVPHPGYWLADLAHFPWYLRWSSYLSDELIESNRFRGIHGYDPVEVPAMRGVFFAWGGPVAPAQVLEGMRSIDVHPTIAALLGIESGDPVDGRARLGLE